MRHQSADFGDEGKRPANFCKVLKVKASVNNLDNFPIVHRSWLLKLKNKLTYTYK